MRIVILTKESIHANFMTHSLIQERPGQVVGIVSSDFLIYGKSLKDAIWYLLRRSGFRFVARKALHMALGRAIRFFSMLIDRPLKVISLRDIEAKFGIPIFRSKDVNDLKTLRVINHWRPDLVISIYMNQLLNSDLIHMPSLGCLNIHPSLLPSNGGIMPYFWSLANGDKETGATLHWINEEFDTGDIFLQKAIIIKPDDTVASLAYRSAQVGTKLLLQGLDLIETGEPLREKQDTTKATYYSWPRLKDLNRFRKKGFRFGNSLKYIW